MPTSNRRARWAVTGVITAAAAAGFAMVVMSGRTSSALLFVFLPAALAAMLTWTQDAATAHGMTFKAVTIALLIAASLLQEAAVCVLFSAPLVYLVAHTTVAAVRWLRNRGDSRRPGGGAAAVLLPLVLLAGLEGVTPQLRIDPEASATATRVVDLEADEVALRVEDGPRLEGASRAWLLRVGYAPPATASGTGLAVGDRWTFSYRPGGQTIYEVTSREEGRVDFALVSNTEHTAMSYTIHSGTLEWTAVGGGRTEVSVTFDYTRDLDPSWYFGPIQHVWLTAGADHLLRSLTSP